MAGASTQIAESDSVPPRQFRGLLATVRNGGEVTQPSPHLRAEDCAPIPSPGTRPRVARDIEEQNPDPTLGRREGGSGHQRKPDRDRPEIATPFLCGAAAAVALIPERATH